jgi:hypothetical protein
LFLIADSHGDLFTRTGGSPDGDREAALQDHVVAEQVIGFHIGRRNGAGPCKDEKSDDQLAHGRLLDEIPAKQIGSD